MQTDSATQSAGALLQALSEGAAGVNISGKITYLSATAVELLGLSEPTHAIGRSASELFVFADTSLDPLRADFLARLLRRGVPLGPILNRRLRTAHGEFAIDYALYPVDGENALWLFQRASTAAQGASGLLYQASHDTLTALPNRSAMQQTLAQLDAQSHLGSCPYTLLLIDLDRFKLINDSYGQATGDALLRHFAAQALPLLRPGDSLGRWGGEEFLCLLPNTDTAAGLQLAETLRIQFTEARFTTPTGRPISVTASIGLAGYPADGDDPDTLLSRASVAQAEAKRAGRNRVYSSKQVGPNVYAVAAKLEQALSEQRIRAAYQPIVEVNSGRMVAEEALARMILPDGQLLPAAQFIEAAERLQLAHRIDHQITRRTIRRCTEQVMAGHGPIAHFVNISADLLRHPDLVQDILATAIESCTMCFPGATQGEKPLVIEITERELLEDVDEAKRLLTPFLDFGLRLAIDDFGSGYSSLLYLADLPVTFLKLEGALVRRAPHEQRVRDILRGVQDMAGELGLTTIAECVEDEATLSTVREIGITWAQGYYFGRPELETT